MTVVTEYLIVLVNTLCSYSGILSRPSDISADADNKEADPVSHSHSFEYEVTRAVADHILALYVQQCRTGELLYLAKAPRSVQCLQCYV